MAFNNSNYNKEYIQIPYKTEFLNLPPYMTLPGSLPPHIQSVSIYPPSNIPPYNNPYGIPGCNPGYNPGCNPGYNPYGNPGYNPYGNPSCNPSCNPYPMIPCCPWIPVTLIMPLIVTFKDDVSKLQSITFTSNICGKFIYKVCKEGGKLALAQNTSDFSSKYFNRSPPYTTLTITPFSFRGELYTFPVIILEKTKSTVHTSFQTSIRGDGDPVNGLLVTVKIVYIYSGYDCTVFSIGFSFLKGIPRIVPGGVDPKRVEYYTCNPECIPYIDPDLYTTKVPYIDYQLPYMNPYCNMKRYPDVKLCMPLTILFNVTVPDPSLKASLTSSLDDQTFKYESLDQIKKDALGSSSSNDRCDITIGGPGPTTTLNLTGNCDVISQRYVKEIPKVMTLTSHPFTYKSNEYESAIIVLKQDFDTIDIFLSSSASGAPSITLIISYEYISEEYAWIVEDITYHVNP